MSLLWIEGFEFIGDPVDMPKKYWDQGATATLVKQSGRVAGYSVVMDAEDYIALGSSQITLPSTIIVGMALRLTNIESSFRILELGKIAHGDQCYVQITSVGGGVYLAYIKDGNNVTKNAEDIVISTLCDGAWHYLEIKLVVGDSGSATIHVDGVELFSESGIDLQYQTTNAVNFLKIRGPATFYIDDIYILDTTGDRNNDFPGPQVVEGYLPTGDGNYTEWTAQNGGTHYTEIDDIAWIDNGTTQVYASVTGKRDTYTFPDWSYVLNDVKGIQFNVCAKNVGTDRYLVPLTRKAGVDYESSSIHMPVTTFPVIHTVLESSPATGEQFTISEINACEFGFKLADS